MHRRQSMATGPKSVALRVMPADVTVHAKPNETVSQALERAGFVVETPCGGNGTCGKCRIRVANAGLLPATPHAHLSAKEIRQGIRLACQLQCTCDLTVYITDGWRDIRRPAQLTRTASARSDLQPKGLAVDLGTTTVVATLVSLGTGDELATACSRNPQARFGHDVISRIQKGSSPQGLAELNRAIVAELDAIVRQLCDESHSDRHDIVDVVLGGNPTMLQLAAGIDPTPLGHAPFRVDLDGGTSFSAGTFGLALSPTARAYVPPIIHAFVGSDVSAGLLVAKGFFESSASALYVDLGTNGELVLRSPAGCLATSTAAGPAFEGGGLRCGMAAVAGAVQAVRVDNGDLSLLCVDDAPPRGLCGSGVLDLVAALLSLQVLDPTGRMVRSSAASHVPPRLRARLFELDGQPAIRIADEVVFTQEDVRQVQLAKGAIRTGIDLLLEAAGTRPRRLIIAGSFGTQLRLGSLTAVGMLPSELDRDVSFAGNASRAGCVRLLQDATLRRKLHARMRSVRYLSLVERPEYAERFVTNMEFVQ
jgi:uncharacterized 2Fe-2S/4Fe-4S cluster protein (DUF4445 family)